MLHIVILALAFYAVARVFVQRGERERRLGDEHRRDRAEVQARRIPLQYGPRCASAASRVGAAHVPLPELAKQVTTPASPAPPHHRTSVPSKIERDQAGFAKEVAQLNAQNDPHAIPTIEPDRREPSSKQYAFDVPANLRGNEHGNGIITPTHHWHDDGRDCYYGRYEFTYPDGSEEYGDIAWPFCYDPALDPFKLPPHPIPFPFPLPGYRLPSSTQLPPIEKSVYQDWVASGGLAP